MAVLMLADWPCEALRDTTNWQEDSHNSDETHLHTVCNISHSGHRDMNTGSSALPIQTCVVSFHPVEKDIGTLWREKNCMGVLTHW